ncbi:uncharacterized protein LOC129939034 isoform X2 [Eupeodes corollae]|uniref:uncharacterized protein LOC129939034 isoform X2 n=1 Tax=Eupeodes corollae TaxID=290404 RepID=UPI0024925A7B|nr:uncharacterized protein LOC129939034 isoform X2 [Eupeodes corollae]
MMSIHSCAEPALQNTEFKWTHSANWLLINSYLDLKDEFRDPRIRKKDLWIQISEKFRDVGYEIPYDLLDKKFRNLKSTYFQVKERNQHSSHKSIKWEYYKVFDELLKGDEAAAANFATVNDPRLSNLRSSGFVPIDSRKRKRPFPSSMTKTDDSSEPPRGDKKLSELDDNIIEDSQDGTFAYEYDEHENYGNTNRESVSSGNKINMENLEARKLHAETRYYNKKADYFEKQTVCLDIQRKLMLMQAHKLKLEIEQMRNDIK